MDNTITEKLTQLKAFARNDGLLLGGMMIASFLFVVGSFARPVLSVVSQLSLLATVIVLWWFVKRFRDNILEGSISFRRAYLYSVYTMFYGALVFSIFQFIYFKWIDNGAFINNYLSVLNSDEGTQMLAAMGLGQTDVAEITSLMTSLSPLDYALQSVVSTFFISLLLSLVIAAIVRR